MYLLVDVGNTNIKFALFINKKIIKIFKIRTDKNKTIDEYYMCIKCIIDSLGYNIYDIKTMIISSVVHKLTIFLKLMWKKYINKRVFLIDINKKLPITIDIDDPSSLGNDIISTSAGSFIKYKNNCIVIDSGTATTVSLIKSNGTFVGVSILPGFKYLTDFSSITDQISFDFYKHNYVGCKKNNSLGKNTNESLISGLIYGYCGMIDNLIKKIIKQYKLKEYNIILTGGNFNYYKDNSEYYNQIISETNIAFYGIINIYKINN